MLCEHALEAFEQYGVFKEDATATHTATLNQGFIKAGKLADGITVGAPRGMLVNYETLPGFVPTILPALFGVDVDPVWMRNMKNEASEYSKSSSKNFLKAGKFSGDSKLKEERASDIVEKYANSILGPSYKKMLEISERVISTMKLGHAIPRDNMGHIKWADMKPIVISSTAPEGLTDLPFNPFESTHNSTAFEVNLYMS